MFKQCLLWLALSATGLAQTLQLESGLVTREDTLKGALVLNSPLSGQGQLTLTWTDSYGRTVAVESRKVTLKDPSVPFELRLKPAVALFNSLSVELTSGQSTVKAGPSEFVVTPNEPWDDYQVIMYYAYKPEQQAALRQLGVTAGQIQNVGQPTARWRRTVVEKRFPLLLRPDVIRIFCALPFARHSRKRTVDARSQGTLQGRPHAKGRFLPQTLLP